MTILGLIITVILFICKLFKLNITIIKKVGFIYGIKVGPDYWGGLEMGLMFLRDHKSDETYINNHEFGHTFQNCLLGPLFPFLVAIPSAIRYWYQTIRGNKRLSNKPYDGMWFEDAATQCGNYAIEYLKNK